MLRILDLPFGPNQCAIVPGRAKDPDGFIDTSNELHGIDPHVYLSAAGIVECAKKLGFTVLRAEEVEERADEVHRLEVQIQDLEDQLQQADGYINAIDVLESAQFRARKKPGRPKVSAESS